MCTVTTWAKRRSQCPCFLALMKPLSRESFASYAHGQSALLRKLQVAKECRAPLFPLLRKMLENPLEELVTTEHPSSAPLQVAVDRDGGVMLL